VSWVVIIGCNTFGQLGTLKQLQEQLWPNAKINLGSFLGSYFPIFGLTKLYHIRIWVTWVQWSPKPQDGPSHPNN
jgi:hypothetical protein